MQVELEMNQLTNGPWDGQKSNENVTDVLTSSNLIEVREHLHTQVENNPTNALE